MQAQAEARALAIYFQGVRSAMTGEAGMRWCSVRAHAQACTSRPLVPLSAEVDVIAKVHTVRSIGACMEELARSPADPVRAVQLVRTRVLRALNEVSMVIAVVHSCGQRDTRASLNGAVARLCAADPHGAAPGVPGRPPPPW